MWLDPAGDLPILHELDDQVLQVKIHRWMSLPMQPVLMRALLALSRMPCVRHPCCCNTTPMGLTRSSISLANVRLILMWHTHYWEASEERACFGLSPGCFFMLAGRDLSLPSIMLVEGGNQVEVGKDWWDESWCCCNMIISDDWQLMLSQTASRTSTHLRLTDVDPSIVPEFNPSLRCIVWLVYTTNA